MKLAILLLLGVTSYAVAAPKFSAAAWKKAAPIYDRIVKHPFNVELSQGTLSAERFAFYKAQDAAYLTAFAKALGQLAVKLDVENDIADVVGFMRDCLDERDAKAKPTPPTAASLFYTSYLLATAAYRPPEETAAALLPCFWLYLVLAQELKKNSPEKNPYAAWLDAYSSEKYRQAVDKMIALTDRLAERSPRAKERMEEAFLTAFELEWRFWDDSYRMLRFRP